MSYLVPNKLFSTDMPKLVTRQAGIFYELTRRPTKEEMVKRAPAPKEDKRTMALDGKQVDQKRASRAHKVLYINVSCRCLLRMLVWIDRCYMRSPNACTNK